MMTGARVVLFSPDAAADRAFLRDVLGLPHPEGGGDRPLFALPAAEVAVHPGDVPAGDDARCALYLSCDDLRATLAEFAARGAAPAGPPRDEGWGILTRIRLPSGTVLGLCQPRHPVAFGPAAEAADGGTVVRPGRGPGTMFATDRDSDPA